MSIERMGDQTRLAVHAASKGRRSFLERFLTSSLYRWRFGGAASDHFLIVPQDLRTADPSFATEIYHGHFGLAGTLVVVGSSSPFAVEAPNEAWARELHGFSWMRDLRASQDDMALEHSRFLLLDWIAKSSRMEGVAWNTEVTARRVLSWLCHAPLLLDEVGEEDYDRVMRSFGQQLRYLSASYANTDDGAPRLTSLIALVFAGLCLGEREDFLNRFLGTFCRELNRQIYRDGGHISRNPWTNVELLLDLLPLKQCFVARDKKPPKELIGAIERMLPMVRFMRLGDGYLGRFNGMAATLPNCVATILSYDDSDVSLTGQAPQSGYTRIKTNDTILIIDSGRPPALTLSADAHAGCLSFEFSSGTSPLIVNSGAPGPAYQEWRLNARATSAHSTVTIEGASSSRILKPRLVDEGKRAPFLSGPALVKSEIQKTSKGTHFVGSHDGFVERFGAVHLRKLQLDPTGTKLHGEDHLFAKDRKSGKSSEKKGSLRYAVHLHLHPDVRVTRPDVSGPVLIDLPNGERWTFDAEVERFGLEESLFLSDYRGPRQGLQIVLRGRFDKEVRVRWRFEKSDTASKSSSDGAAVN